MLYTLQHMGTGEADLVIQNSGGVRISIMPGEFTYDSGYTLLPFSNTLYTLKMTGAEIKAVLEDALDFALAGIVFVGRIIGFFLVHCEFPP